jgi:beta-glucosidase
MLIDALARANPCTLVVLQTGNPVAMPWLDRVRAVLQVWYPGQEGGAAIAALLTGSANPSGRLPITFPRRAEHAPRLLPPGLGLPAGSAQPINYSEGADVGYRWYARRRQRPLFAFGHGLSYTSFEHGRPELAIEGGELVAHCTVRNSGERAGAEVLQLYLLSAAGTACRRLVGFARVPLAPGEQRRLALSVRPHLLADWTGDGWTLRRGSYRLALGRSAIKLGRPVSITLPQRQLPA